MMHRAIISMAALLFSVSALAANPFEVIRNSTLKNIEGRSLLNWTVGDNANYNMDMGFLKGTMTMSVASVSADEIWMNQDMDLGGFGKQKAEILIDANTGAVKKMIVNGQEQQIPEQDMELIEIITDTVTVPAGTFECQHIRLKDNKSGGEVKVWSNAEVALAGMVKTIQPGQFGDVTLELTSFLKQ